jgi:hypothetical protein
MLTETQLQLAFLKAGQVSLSTALLMEQVAMVALQIRVGLVELVLQVLFISHGHKTRNV